MSYGLPIINDDVLKHVSCSLTNLPQHAYSSCVYCRNSQKTSKLKQFFKVIFCSVHAVKVLKYKAFEMDFILKKDRVIFVNLQVLKGSYSRVP